MSFMRMEIIGLDRTLNYFKDLEKKSQGIGDNILRDFGNQAVMQLRRELRMQKLTYTTYLHNNIRWRQQKRFAYLTIPQYGTWLDSASPHYVRLQRGRRITKWALDKGNPTIRKIAERAIASKSKTYIYVRPHPWIDKGLNRALRKLPTIVKRQTEKLIKK